MRKLTFWLIFTQLLIFTTLTRFGNIAAVPYAASSILLSRRFSALLAVASTALLVLVSRRYLKSSRISLLAGYFFTILPHALFEGRINSWVTQYEFFLLLALYLYGKKIISKVFALSVFLISTSYYLFQLNYLFQPATYLDKYGKWVANLFDLISFRKLFFTNDLYLDISINSVGIMLPILILPFLVGVLVALSKRILFPFACSLLILLLAAINPDYPFPHSRIVGLINPFFALLLALGVNSLHNHVPKSQKQPISRFYFSLWITYLLIFSYSLSLFFHDYHYHYLFEIMQKNIYYLNNL